jgi:hypothetical protein
MAPPLLTPHKCRCRAYKCCKLPGGFNTVGRTTYYKHALADRLCGLHELKQEQDAPAQDIPAQLPDEPLPDNRAAEGVPMLPPLEACPTGYMYLVPVARAFETVAF